MGRDDRGISIALWARRIKQNRFKLLLLAVILMMFGIIIAIFIGNRGAADKAEPAPPTSQDEVSVAIGKVHQTATRDGKTEWRMDAASVKYMEDQGKAFFEDISITFFLENNEEVYLTANQGTLKTDTNDIEVHGNVVVKNTDYRLTSETINYRHKDRIITSTVPVQITGDVFSLTADTMRVDLNHRNARFEGNIKGNIDENAKF